jgi:glycosyltransferase involved in cell wall biosynthesis
MTVIQLISSLDRGGAENHLADLCSGLTDNKKIIIFCAGKRSFWSNKLKKKIIIIHSKLTDPKNFFEKIIKFISDIIQLRTLLKKYKPAILHAHLPYMEIVGYTSLLFNNKIKFVITKHLDNIFFKQSYGQKNDFFGKIIIKIIHYKAKYVIAISKSVKNFLIKNNLVNDIKKIKIIYYGINFKNFNKKNKKKILSFKKKYSINNKILTIGTISRLVPQKSLETLIDAIFIIKNNFKLKVKLIIVGKGSDKNKLQKISNKKNLTKDIVWIDYLSDTNQFYKSIDTFCMASLYEGLGLVLLESMCNKTIIVASKINVFKEIIKDGKDGLLFETQNSKDLALKIITSTKKIRKSIIKNAFIKVNKNFNLKKNLNKTNFIYEKILADKNIK